MAVSSTHQATTQQSQPSGIAALGINAPTLITQVFNVVILFLVLRWLLYRPLTELMERRRTVIEDGLARAEQAKRDSESADVQATALLTSARHEAKQLLEQARENAERAGAGIILKAEEQSQRMIEQARLQLDQERGAMKAELEGELGGLVVAATERVLNGKQIPIAAADIEQSLGQELRQHGA